jgi:hypothetical protein
MADDRQRGPLRFPPSREEYSHVERTDVDATCPSCESGNVARYPSLRFEGWFEITRCQDCFHTLEESEIPIHGKWEPWTWGWNKGS